eukprot:2652680-Pleurochrysis_carterae.AAC.1
MAIGILVVSASLMPVISCSQLDPQFQRLCFYLHNSLLGAGFLIVTVGNSITALQVYVAMTEMLKARAVLAAQTNNEDLRSSLGKL